MVIVSLSYMCDISLFEFSSELARLVKQIAEELHKRSYELILVIPATKKGYGFTMM